MARIDPEIVRLVFGSGSFDDQRLAAALGVYAETAREHLTGVSMPGIDGAPDSLGFEVKLWEASESIRQRLIETKFGKGRSALMDMIEKIVCNEEYAKGRENFVLVLGSWGGDAYRPSISGLLDSADVQAHALHALRLLRDGRHIGAARELAVSGSSVATRHEAKKYLRRFAD